MDNTQIIGDLKKLKSPKVKDIQDLQGTIVNLQSRQKTVREKAASLRPSDKDYEVDSERYTAFSIATDLQVANAEAELGALIDEACREALEAFPEKIHAKLMETLDQVDQETLEHLLEAYKGLQKRDAVCIEQQAYTDAVERIHNVIGGSDYYPRPMQPWREAWRIGFQDNVKAYFDRFARMITSLNPPANKDLTKWFATKRW